MKLRIFQNPLSKNVIRLFDVADYFLRWHEKIKAIPRLSCMSTEGYISAKPLADIMHPSLSLTKLEKIYPMPLHNQMLFIAILNNNCLVPHKL